MYGLYLFQINDWYKVIEFQSEKEAETFVESYPMWGSVWSKTIRNGNWQIVKD